MSKEICVAVSSSKCERSKKIFQIFFLKNISFISFACSNLQVLRLQRSVINRTCHNFGDLSDLMSRYHGNHTSWLSFWLQQCCLFRKTEKQNWNIFVNRMIFFVFSKYCDLLKPIESAAIVDFFLKSVSYSLFPPNSKNICTKSIYFCKFG